MLAVPFENLDIHLGVANVLDPEHVFDKIVTRRRGGWCYELNGSFALLLEALGFAVTRYSASVVLSDPPSPDFAHLTLRVDLDRPMARRRRLRRQLHPPASARRRRRPGARRQHLPPRRAGPDGRMVLHENGLPRSTRSRSSRAGWSSSPRCARSSRPLPGSHFLDAPICSRATEDGRVSLAGMRLITTTGDDRSERELESEANGPPSCATSSASTSAPREFVPSSTSLEIADESGRCLRTSRAPTRSTSSAALPAPPPCTSTRWSGSTTAPIAATSSSGRASRA